MFVYLDNAATTQVFPEAVAESTKYMSELYGNPSAGYSFATRNKALLNRSKRTLSGLINADQSEIVFTSGGTEADNLAIVGSYLARAGKGSHIITTGIEHPAVLNSCSLAESLDCRITCIKPDSHGFIAPSDIEAAIRPDTYLISVMLANNELGTLEPIKEIGEIARRHGVLLHTDAVQAFLHCNIDVKEMNIDMLSVSAHKFGGPKGVGFLYVRNGVELKPLMVGGGQEDGLRSGTENVPAIAAMSKAAEIMHSKMQELENIARLRNRLRDRLVSEVPGVQVNSPEDRVLPGHLNLSFEGIEGETLLIRLDMRGICCSTGSACSTGKSELSHVLLSCGHDENRIRGSLRLTLGISTTKEEVDYAADVIREEVKTLRALRGITL